MKMENNYLTEIFTTKRSKENLVHALAKLAYADNQVDKTEIQIVQEIALQVGLGQEIPSQQEVKEIKILFDNREQEISFFKEAIRLAIVDENYSDIEREFLKSLSESFGWSKEDFSKLEEEQESLHWLKPTQTIELD
ncbi:TPA: TerB family tellurite resistance protein [Vibrio parahaemolyticus]|nr:TerB family tellurite resistance protein [Vibrio parahaemolyticus]MBO0206629.1 TerB family tellurite resistance protein [Vibrio sp. Vb0877]MBS9991612.1 TerB family tellurite resistance protein [Vibrio alginolyticus]HCG6132060.1 TerB family tellurite resistance protein [Vibrio parahaemolyticus]HCH5773524.1 TerB family tellurite resistance protein [Vibrio parahaemolyticus]